MVMHIQIILRCLNILRRIQRTCYDFCEIIEDSKTKMYSIITRKSKIHTLTQHTHSFCQGFDCQVWQG